MDEWQEQIMRDVMRRFEIEAQIAPLHDKVLKGWNDLSVRFSNIRKIYEIIKDEDYDPYWTDFPKTPIEFQLWTDIRGFRRNVQMYREYPVGKYFVDFGDPWKRVAIEADGADYHDPEKDKIRDRNLMDMGWRVYRVKGKDCIKEGVIKHILEEHYA